MKPEQGRLLRRNSIFLKKLKTGRHSNKVGERGETNKLNTVKNYNEIAKELKKKKIKPGQVWR